jgi:hypothetical protein
MTLTQEEITALNKQRIQENNREKAEQFRAEVEADRQNGWSRFIEKHCGQRAVTAHNVFYDCIANRLQMERWIEEKGLLVDFASLETAFDTIRESLAQPPEQSYRRRTDTQQSRVMPQLKSFAPPALVLPYTREMVLGWSKDRLKQEMGKSPRHVAALNLILQN